MNRDPSYWIDKSWELLADKLNDAMYGCEETKDEEPEYQDEENQGEDHE